MHPIAQHPVADDPNRTDRLLVWMCCACTFALPYLMGYGVMPLTNFGGEVIAAVGFGACLFVAAKLGLRVALDRTFLISVSVPIGLALATIAQYYMHGQRHWDVYSIYVVYLAAAALAVWLGSATSQSKSSQTWGVAVAFCVLAGASFAALASAAQYLGVDLSGLLLSPPAEAGRTYGFLRQPNHQATCLSLGLAALFAVNRRVKIAGLVWYGLVMLLVSAIVSTGSRTGLLQILFISIAFFLAPLQGKRDRRCIELLILSACIWLAMFWGSESVGLTFYGSAKLAQTGSEGLGLRASLWYATLALIADKPWFGYGPLAFPSTFLLSGSALATGVPMSNAHNVLLQLAFDYGVPATLMVAGALAWVVWSSRRIWTTERGALPFVSLGCIGIHSMFEFPMWYSYFLIPAFYWLGVLIFNSGEIVVGDTKTSSTHVMREKNWQSPTVAICGCLAIWISVSMNRDFYRLTPVYMQGPVSTLNERLEVVNKVFWFRRFADFILLQREIVTKENSQQYLEKTGSLGCVMMEPWYQASTIVALDFEGNHEDARWILYLFSQLSKKNMNDYVQSFGASAEKLTPNLLEYAVRPYPVSKHWNVFADRCFQ